MTKTIALDFDGVLHPYTRGWTGPVPDDEPPTYGAVAAVQRIKNEGYRVSIFTCRALTADGRAGVIAWCKRYGIEADEVTAIKPHAVLYVDDRAIRFEGNWSQVVIWARQPVLQKPWNADHSTKVGQIDPAKWKSDPPRCGHCGGAVDAVTPEGRYTACGHAIPDAERVT
ncbi:MAG TPA: hypothetical protein VEA38_23010 [Terriglobales bacterium]|nr:hypothetical protein [Terriglobales bacterium]